MKIIKLIGAFVVIVVMSCTAVVDVSAAKQDQNLKVSKIILGEKNDYKVGDKITFRVEIANVGSTTIDKITFRDEYNPGRLRLQADDNLTAFFELRNADTTTSEIYHEDLTAVIGDLKPSQVKQLDFEFILVRMTNETCNQINLQYSLVKSTEMSIISDKVCVQIVQNAPKTDL